MKFIPMMLAASAMVAPGAAHALTGALGTNGSAFVSLSTAGLGGGSIATLTGGTVYTSDQPFADIPAGGVFGGTFLAAGPSSGTSATLTLVQPASYVSFLWGSPDLYNSLIVTTNLGSFTYNVTNLSFTSTNGNQSFSQPVQFTAGAGETIRSLTFTNTSNTDAFEVANFKVTSAVPETATWAMMLVGFGGMGATMRYRRRSTTAAMA